MAAPLFESVITPEVQNERVMHVLHRYGSLLSPSTFHIPHECYIPQFLAAEDACDGNLLLTLCCLIEDCLCRGLSIVGSCGYHCYLSLSVLFAQVKVSLFLDTTAWTSGPYATPPVSSPKLESQFCRQHSAPLLHVQMVTCQKQQTQFHLPQLSQGRSKS